MLHRLLSTARWRLWRIRRRLSVCTFRYMEAWPDMEPMDPRHKGVKTYSYTSHHLTPFGAWRAAKEWA